MSDILIFILCAVMSTLAWYLGAASGFRKGLYIGYNVALDSIEGGEGFVKREKANAPAVE